MSSTIDFDSIDRLISNAGVGSFELDVPLPRAQSTSVRPRKQKPQVSPDFLIDLDLAGRRVLGAIAELLQTEKDAEELMTALDGASDADRTNEERAHLVRKLQSFAQGAETLQFVPATNAETSEPSVDGYSLPHGCACALEPDLSTVYVSAELGFRDLFQMTQSAAVKALILHLEPMGIVRDPIQAFVDVSKHLGHEVIDPEDEAMMEETWLGTPAGKTPTYATAFFPST